MDLDFRKKEKLVGTFLVSVAVLLLSTVVFIGRGQDWFKSHIIYYTTFDESYNLQVNAAVKLFKADIGKIKKITLEGDKVKVKLAIVEEFSSRVRTDSLATVESPTLIGDEYISIKPGSSDAPLISEEGLIPSSEKKSISDLLEEFKIEKTAKKIINTIDDLSDINGPLYSAINNTNKIIQDIQEGKGTVGNLLKSKDLVNNIIARLDDVDKIIKDINKATKKTPETMDRVNNNLETIGKISDGVHESVTDINTMLKDVEKSITSLKAALANIEKSSNDFPKVTQSTKLGIQEIRNGVKNIDKVFQSLQKNIFIRSNIPVEAEGENTDAGLRQ
ncbi:MAG: MCE family protein [Desulfobacterales bacterium]|jgi:phospholipid/cholesterol/gamma-HCH transport system substrate-binding protein|nr:MCE family protein [Desulfobacteraceae bacterium]MBT4364482.1 MCE family protein [Desulfobacteraceae bacterium]MBT7084987.1 MCE family protein [Desulfobacterales bacterium]